MNQGACSLFIPHKRWAYTTPTLQVNPDQEEDNYVYLEQWSRRFILCFPHHCV